MPILDIHYAPQKLLVSLPQLVEQLEESCGSFLGGESVLGIQVEFMEGSHLRSLLT